jgi:S-phase kinase-associated protein 1
MAAEAAAAGKEKMLTLISSDLEKFEVEESAARESRTIGNMIEDSCADNDIPLPNVNARILAKVIVYCRKHASARGGTDAGDAEPTAATNKASEDELKTFDAEFVKVDQATLFDLILVRPSHLFSAPDSCLDLPVRTVKGCCFDLLVRTVKGCCLVD